MPINIIIIIRRRREEGGGSVGAVEFELEEEEAGCSVGVFWNQHLRRAGAKIGSNDVYRISLRKTLTERF